MTGSPASHTPALASEQETRCGQRVGHLGWAEGLAVGGDKESAREHVMRALELSREHGYGAFEKRAAVLAETASAAGS